MLVQASNWLKRFDHQHGNLLDQLETGTKFVQVRDFQDDGLFVLLLPFQMSFVTIVPVLTTDTPEISDFLFRPV